MLPENKWCEVKVLKDDTEDFDLYDFTSRIAKNEIRVPYLIKEYIEAAGWKDTTAWLDETKKQSLANFPNFTFETKTGSLRLYLKSLHDPSKGISIEEYKRSTGEPWSMSSFFNRYNGECKDINTFRFICKLLGI